MKHAPVLIVGLGRPHHGDDAAGLLVAAALEQRLRGVADVACGHGDGWEILEEGGDRRLMVIIDAAEADEGLPAGEWVQVDSSSLVGGPADFSLANPHAPSVEALLQLAASLGCLPDEVWIYAIAGQVFEAETELSPPVHHALGLLTDAIESDVRAWTHQPRR